MRNMKLRAMLVACIFGLLQSVHGFWDGEKWWYVEHQFEYADATFQVNKAYSGSGVTDYKLTMKTLEDDVRGLRVAFQWIFGDGTYKGMVFQLKIPESGEKEAGKVLEGMNKARYYPNPNNNAQTEYIKNIVAGEYVTEEEPDVVNLVTRINVDGDLDGTKVELSFRVNGHEPLGKTRFWMAWEQYEEDVSCVSMGTCISTERVIVPEEPFDYFNGEDFGNALSRAFILGCYWTMEGAGVFGLIGLPVNLLAYVVMNTYLTLMTISGFWKFSIAARGGFDEDQAAYYSFQNWFLEQLLYWDIGTKLLSTVLLLMTLVPVIGPIFGVVYLLIIEPLITL